MTQTATGIYAIGLTDVPQDNVSVIPVATAEIDVAPTAAINLRIVSVNQDTATNVFVYINNGTGALVDNDFMLVVTGR